MLSISSFGSIMDELFGGIGGKLRMISITDSTMMRIVHGAMNKAHERVKSKEGVIERLNEISKFYELAVMQLEGCMKFVQDESSHEEEVLAGLLEIRDRLKGRLGESERAITDKDRELIESAESETRLRQALEMKDRELSSLKAKLEMTRNISEGVDGRDGEFSELKNSVDQQVWNIRQRLEPDYDDQGGEIGDEKVEQMGTDIDALKETLDVAFKKMRSAIFSSEVAPIERQWRWGVEKDTYFVLIRGLVSDFQEKFEGKERGSKEREFPVGFDEFWHGFADEVEGLKSELGTFLGRLEEIVQEKRGGGSPRAKPITEEVKNGENGNYVTKMIKNHESIIREKSAEAERLSLLRQEVMREKALPSSRRENEPVCLIRRSQDLMVKLDGLIEWNDKLREHLGDRSNDDEIVFDTSIEARERTNTVSCSVIEEVPNKISKLEQELQDSNLETVTIEEAYVVLFEGMLEELNFNLCKYNKASLIKEEIFQLVALEALKDAFTRTVADDQGIRSGSILCDEKLKTRQSTQESSVQSEDHLLKCQEPEEHLMQSRCFEFIGKENIFTSSAVFADPLAVYDQERRTICLEQDRETSTLQLDQSVLGFFQMMADFELMVEEKLELNTLRLEEIYDHSLNPIVKIVSSLSEHESLYRKAFIRRCQNLHKAEIEVDLLGDQVEVLLSLLQKIYTSLRNCSPILQQSVCVSELLPMIKTELKGVIHTPNLQI